MSNSTDPIRWLPHIKLEKYASEEDHRQQLPYEVVEQDGNLLTTAGLTRIMSLLVGAGGQAADNGHTRLGVGNSAVAEAAGQTDLQAAAGAANRWFQVMDATYPQVAAGVLTAKATFGSADGNFVWNEWGLTVDNSGSISGTTVGQTLLNRKVAALGTKAAGAIWVLTCTITLA
ncbi:hypothetical protein ACIBSW_34560 [Actinoplanes sp. NPDC049668]|uniref:hypothetical protein n=1 Tax=unclassified Actinoplanes TaxID=2626549 RepID=UPI0033BB1BBC